MSERIIKAARSPILLAWIASVTAAAISPTGIALAETASTPPAGPTLAADSTTADSGSAGSKPEQVVISGARQDYKIDNVTTLGPFGSIQLQDTPYSINVTPGALIENRNVHTESEALRTNPTVGTLVESNGYSSLSRVMIRGFTAADQNDLRDGMTDRSFTLPPIENVSRIEVLNGLSGFLYGFSAVGGTINYVTKDPLTKTGADISAGVYGGGIAYGEADFGGPLANNVNYRITLYKEGGDTYMDKGTQKRLLASGVINFQLAEHTSLKADFYHQDFYVDGLQTYFSPFTSNGVVQVPGAFNSSRQYGQSWTFNKAEKELFGARFNSELNDTFSIRAGYRYGTMWRSYQYVQGFLTATPGAYTERFVVSPRQFEYTNTAYVLADAHFDTGPFSHELTVGFTGSGYIFLRGNDSAATPIGASTVNAPADLSLPTIAGYRDVLTTNAGQFLSNYLLGDRISFGQQWSTLVGINYAEIHAFSKTLAAGPQTLTPGPGNTYDYVQGRWSPSASLIYKPISEVSLYGSYMEGLAAGGIAPALFTFNNVTKAVANANQQLTPSVSRQYEVGAKGNLGNLSLTAALFRISKINEETDPSDFTYKQDGREVHEGLELTATGKVSERLTVVGGLTWMQARIDQATAVPTSEGKIPINVPEKEARLFVEYEIPGVRDLTASLGANYFGKRPVDSLNTGFIPDATTFDAGIRYEPTLWGHQTSFNLTVANLFDRSYWSFFRSGDGLSLALPRIVAFSTRVSF